MALIASHVQPGKLPSAKSYNEIIDVLTSLLRSSGANFFVDSQGIHIRQQTQARVATIQITIDGGDAAITTTSPSMGGATIPAVPVAATITGWAVEGDQAGAIAVDVLRCTAAAAAANPTNVTGQLASIVGSGNKPTLVASNQYAAGTPSGWTSTQLAVGDVIGFSVASAATVQRVTVSLTVVY